MYACNVESHEDPTAAPDTIFRAHDSHTREALALLRRCDFTSKGMVRHAIMGHVSRVRCFAVSALLPLGAQSLVTGCVYFLPRQEGSKQRFEDLKKNVSGNIEVIKNYPAELRASGVWQTSSEVIAKQTSIGLVVGLAVGVVLFSKFVPPTRPVAAATLFFHHATHPNRVRPLRSLVHVVVAWPRAMQAVQRCVD